MDGQARIETLPDEDKLAKRVADWMLDLALEAQDRFAVALSGGSTPARLYRLLATETYRDKFPWARAHWFWGDERCVPHTSPRSNYRMAWDAMLSHVPVPPDQIHPVPVDGMPPQLAAATYERVLKSYYGGDALDPKKPLFDIALLGLGEDGHFASLFPGTAALQEKKHWTAAVIGAEKEARITLTYPVLQSCRNAAFLVSGAAKAEILRRFHAGDPDLPASRFAPHGMLTVFADEAAASQVPR